MEKRLRRLVIIVSSKHQRCEFIDSHYPNLTPEKALKRRNITGVGATHVILTPLHKEHRRCDIIPYHTYKHIITSLQYTSNLNPLRNKILQILQLTNDRF